MRTIKIALLGFGNVGTGVYKILASNSEKILRQEGFKIAVKKILVRDISKKRLIDVDSSLFTNKADEIFDDPEIDIVAEFIGGEINAKDYILRALKAGKSVVTANKEVIAKHWEELERTACENGVGLYFEASVAGGIPIIRTVYNSLQANNIQKVMGIINGTTNYILTKMSEENQNFEDVLKNAQKLGYAEADPASDIEGYDAVYKLAILSTICFHQRVKIEQIYREGITKITSEDIEYGLELGYGLKLLAIAKIEKGKLQVRVHPTFIPLSHPLYSVRDSFNAIFIEGDAVGELMLYGRGAGDLPTGSAVVSDIITACNNRGNHSYAGLKNQQQEGLEIEDNWITDFFIRMTVEDRPGVLAEIAGIFAKYNVSIASVIQKDRKEEGISPIIFLTHDAHEAAIRGAMQEIEQQYCVVSVDNIIRVEK